MFWHFLFQWHILGQTKSHSACLIASFTVLLFELTWYSKSIRGHVASYFCICHVHLRDIFYPVRDNNSPLPPNAKTKPHLTPPCFVIKKKLTWEGRTNAQEGEQRIAQRGGGMDKRRAGGGRKNTQQGGMEKHTAGGTEKRTIGNGDAETHRGSGGTKKPTAGGWQRNAQKRGRMGHRNTQQGGRT